MSRESERKIQGCWLYDRYISNVEGFGKSDNILAVDLQDIISKDISNCIYKVSMSEYTTIVSRKLEVLNQQHVLIFTDGSVVGGTIGCGACSMVLFPTDGGEDNVHIATRAVGVKVSSEQCETEGIIFGTEIAIKYFAHNCEENYGKCVYILCDCQKVSWSHTPK